MTYVLRLYVAGATARSREALRSVHDVCEAQLGSRYDLQVVDIYQEPALARKSQIVATPTLVRERPLPVRRFIGNMMNSGKFLLSCDAGRGAGDSP